MTQNDGDVKKIGGATFGVRLLAEGEPPARSRCLYCGQMEVAGSMEGYEEPRCLACGKSQDAVDMMALYQKSLEG